MRKSTLLSKSLVTFVMILFFNACQRETIQNSLSNEIIEKVKSWLNSQKSEDKKFENEKIQALESNLIFSAIRFEPFKQNEQFVIIPINKSFKSENNKDKDPVNNLVLILTKAGNVRKGNIVQYIPEKKQKNATVPLNTFFKIFNSKKTDCNGRFAFLSITDWLLYELKYENGNVRSFGVAKPKKDGIGNARVQTCLDWYLTTTIFYDDGTTYVYETYLGRTCYGGPGEPEVPEFDEGGGGGCCFPDSNIQWSTSNIAESIGLSCSGETTNPNNGLPMKQCTFTWNYNTNHLIFYTWKYKSVENSNVEKIGTEWKFITGGTTHLSSGLVGTIPPCVDFTHSVNSSLPFISGDRKQARMRLDYTNTFKVSCWPWAPIHSETLYSEASWNAP